MDDRDVFADFEEASGGGDIGSLQHAIAGDVGVNDGGKGELVDIAGDIHGADATGSTRGIAGGLRPAVGFDDAVLGVEAQNKAALEAVIEGDGLEPSHIGEGAGAEYDAVCADGQDIFHGFFAADASADFDLKGGGLDDFFDNG